MGTHSDQEKIEWPAALHELFGQSKELPRSAYWTGFDSICSVLYHLAYRTQSEIFLADAGSTILDAMRTSSEVECLELLDKNGSIVKPGKLEFESFGENETEWAYFRLIAQKLDLALESKPLYGVAEYVAEVGAADYRHPDVMQTRVLGFDEKGEEISLPPGSRIVKRYLQGSFVIFSAKSRYGRLDDHQGIHIDQDRLAFRDLVQHAVNRLS